MYERATAQMPAYALPFCSVELPPHWDGKRTVQVTDEDGNESMMTVAPAVANALRRAALLTPHHLCSRIDLGIDSSGLHVVEVYWES